MTIMRLLYLHNGSLNFQKANTIQVLSMCSAFSELGVAVTLALPNSGIDQRDIKTHLQENFGTVNSFPIKFYKKMTIGGRLNILGSYWGCRKFLRTASADICFVRNPLFLKLALDARLPTIFETHNSILHNQIAILDQRWRNAVVELSGDDNFLKLIAISEALRQVWLERGIPSGKCITLHDGFDADLFEVPKPQSEARRQLGLPLSEKIVVYTGSLYEDRGVENVLKLASHLTNVNFLVVGGPEESKNYYCNLAVTNGVSNISFTGRVPHYVIPDYLFAADVLLMVWSRKTPTINYCSPLKVFEYMASGRIIVGHAFPTIKEVLHDGKTAYLADVDSFEDLLNKLRKGLTDSYPSQMASCARDTALRKYTWIERVRQVLENIEPIISRRRQEARSRGE